MRPVIHAVRSDDQGVASTLGTTMALLVFLTFLSLIVNQYVPAWMKESEAAHTNSVVGQFGSFKGAVDLQILAFHSALNAKQNYIPVTATTAVTLGVDGVPIFATSTPATMTAFPANGLFTVTFDYNIQGVRTRVAEVSNGSIEIDIQNRYFAPQRIVYENGAVIRYQDEGQIVRGAPIFSVRQVNNALDISFGLVTLFGGGTVSGTNTEVISSQLFSFDPQNYANFPNNAVIWINQTSRYGLAWYQFLNETLANALKLSGTFTKTPLDVSFTGKVGATVVY
ncbi:MAG: hypothetical protein ACREDF_07275, partial [Thermoplasmata archaeon]